MWSSLERDAAMMVLIVEAKPRTRDPDLRRYPFSPPDLEVMINDCKAFHDGGGQLLRSHRGGAVTVFLQDIKIKTNGAGRKFAVLLIALSDKRRPDDVVSDPAQGVRRQISKATAEGNEYSCHVVIALTPNSPGGRRYRLAYEQVPLFNFYYISAFVRYVFRSISMAIEYSRPDPSGARTKDSTKDDHVRIVVNALLHVVPSQELLDDLKTGTLCDIELSHENSAGACWDQKRYTVEKRSTLTLKPSISAQNTSIMDVVDSICSTGRVKHYTVAKILWKNAHGRSASARFDCDSASPLDQRYIRRESFSLQSPLPASCQNICNSFSDSLIGWIK